MLKVPTENIAFSFQCPQCEDSVTVTLSDLLEIGTPICTDCDEPMEPDSEAEVDTDF